MAQSNDRDGAPILMTLRVPGDMRWA